MTSFRERMKKQKDQFKKTVSNPAASGLASYPTIFVKSKIPNGVTFFKPKEKTYIIDILPWECGPDMPLDNEGAPIANEGDFVDFLDVAVHQNIGVRNEPFVCPQINFGEPCPICEHIAMERLEKEIWSRVKAKRKAIYLIWDRTDVKTESSGIQIMEQAYFFMEEKLREISVSPIDGGKTYYSDPDEGKHVCFTRKGSGLNDTSYIGHRFIDREAKIPEKILNQTFSLDQVIKMRPTYEEIEKAFKSGTKGIHSPLKGGTPADTRNSIKPDEDENPFLTPHTKAEKKSEAPPVKKKFVIGGKKK